MFSTNNGQSIIIPLPLQQLSNSSAQQGTGSGSGSGSGWQTESGNGSGSSSGTGTGSGSSISIDHLSGSGTGTGSGSGSSSGYESGTGSGSGPGNAFPEMATLGNKVWHDTNENGLQDVGEAGVANVSVRIEGAQGGVPLASTQTDSLGEYSLSFWAYTGLSYRVKIDVPLGFGVSTKNAGTDQTIDNDFDEFGYTSTMIGGQLINDHTIDARLTGVGYQSGSGTESGSGMGSGSGSSTGRDVISGSGTGTEIGSGTGSSTGSGSGTGTSTGSGSSTGFYMNMPPIGGYDSFAGIARAADVTAEPRHHIIGNVLENDFDFNADPLTAILVDAPTHGTLTLNADGTFDYLADAAYVSLDTFNYKANDGQLDSAPVSVWLYVMNNMPMSTPDSYITMENTSLMIPASGLLANDSDTDGDTLTAQLVNGPQHGTVSISPDGSFT